MCAELKARKDAFRGKLGAALERATKAFGAHS
jgi:hypothetical protein